MTKWSGVLKSGFISNCRTLSEQIASLGQVCFKESDKVFNVSLEKNCNSNPHQHIQCNLKDRTGIKSYPEKVSS